MYDVFQHAKIFVSQFQFDGNKTALCKHFTEVPTFIQIFVNIVLIKQLTLLKLTSRSQWPRGLTLNLLTTTIVAPPSNASKWQMEFNSAFKGLSHRSAAACLLRLWVRIPPGAWMSGVGVV
jgi:hypothetical protein